MKMVKSLLLGSAAGLVAVAGAQAADLPVKAKAVEYVKVCSLYGAGFYYIPGTDTCIKLGGFLRVEATHNAGGSFATYQSGDNALYDRGTNVHPFRTRAAISVDVRTQTEYGTLRSYLRGGWQWSTGDNVTSNNNVTYYDRGFIQFAGFTFGKTESFFDFYPVPVYSFQTQAYEGSSGGVGQTVFAYTAQFGNGVSATLSLEDRSFRSSPVVDIANAANLFAFNLSNTTDRTGQNVPDIVANIRVDQAWGSAQIMGALHENSARYYNGVADTLSHPSSEWGWAAGAGLTLKMPWDAKDTLTVQGVYCEGAAKYCFNPGPPNGAGLAVGMRDEGTVAVGWVDDAYFSGAAGSQLELSKAWSLAAGFQHYWTPSLRTSVYTQYANYEANSASVDQLVCVARGFAAGCADWSGWQIGSRTLWNPVANLDVGVDIMYTKVDTAFAGGVVAVAPNGGTAYNQTVADGDVWSAIFRVQRNFWP
jgi:hypothetical protein